ncbi:phosphoribosylamine--glycine ligase [Lachnoclostridium sp. Marseille-P6806]|uniref:phosphoribosylamine--glycine ligase n=1 Tax=Lachnoclostridium sp. Marseille-P6806 TaxID=2364793 RepID=UPI001030F50B|nr:phosphoribosylamine--glycine ligase [Lachnoclostridium sp. Marseille-P6806]
MKILLIGGGGREHAMAAAIVRSPRCEKLYCAPGNAGIAEIAECVPIGVMDFDTQIAFAKEQGIDFVVCSQDDPLCAGLVNAHEAAGLRVFGTQAEAAVIEGSKSFAKNLMKKYGIPTAAYEIFSDPGKAAEYLRERASFPVVLKADGLALGKGVLICGDLEEALSGVREIMEDRRFGDAGRELVVEEFMTGREVSVLAFVDGRNIKLMSSAQDHKRAGDGDTGPNTGGMGTFSPSPFYTEEIDRQCRERIYQKTVDAMAAEGRPFRGVLYFGLMMTQDGPKVVEYNTRFGDPEAQVVLPRMKTDILDVMDAVIDGRLDSVDLEFEDNAAVCVVLASGGYPGAYEKGREIRGLGSFRNQEGCFCFHAGTCFDKDGRVVTDGGRVLGITATGRTLREARENSYRAAEQVSFDGKYMRHDIGRALDEI